MCEMKEQKGAEILLYQSEIIARRVKMQILCIIVGECARTFDGHDSHNWGWSNTVVYLLKLVSIIYKRVHEVCELRKAPTLEAHIRHISLMNISTLLQLQLDNNLETIGSSYLRPSSQGIKITCRELKLDTWSMLLPIASSASTLDSNRVHDPTRSVRNLTCRRCAESYHLEARWGGKLICNNGMLYLGIWGSLMSVQLQSIQKLGHVHSNRHTYIT